MIRQDCKRCGLEGTLKDFAQHDLLCHSCRKEKGPEPRRAHRVPKLYSTPEPRVEPKPSGRRARLKSEPTRVSA